jgi:hypothetical protein
VEESIENLMFFLRINVGSGGILLGQGMNDIEP